MPNIDIDNSKVETHSSNIASSTKSIQIQNLSAIDGVSTISGNEISQQAFSDAQNILSEFVSTLQTESEKIKSLGAEFKFVDTQLAKMIRNF